MSSDGLAALKIDRSRRRRRISPWVWIVAVAILVGAVLAPRLVAGLGVVEVAVAPAVRISAATGEATEGSPELTAAGYVVADRQSVLSAKYTGRLAKLNVAEAQFVKKGDIVAEMDHSELDATIAQSQAEAGEAAAEVERLRKLTAQAETELAAAKTPLETFDAENKQYEILLADAKRRLALHEKLVAGNAVPTSDVDDRRTEVAGMEAKMAWTQRRKLEAQKRLLVAESQLGAARAAVAVAEARRKTAEQRVKVLVSQRDEYFIRSPFDGMVTEKAAEVGEIVAPISIGGSMARGSIVTIADWASLQAEVDVAEAQLSRVKPAQRAAITVDSIPNRVFPGKVCRILPRADRSKATVKVRVDFIDRDRKAILPEMGVRVRFLPDNAPPGVESGAVRDTVAVPKAAVQADAEGSFVWVVNEDTAHRRAVETRANSGDRIEITRGLSPGDRVVVRNAQRLRGESAKVRVEE